MERLVGLFGVKRVGKTSLARDLVELSSHYGFNNSVVLSFAWPLKSLIIEAFFGMRCSDVELSFVDKQLKALDSGTFGDYVQPVEVAVKRINTEIMLYNFNYYPLAPLTKEEEDQLKEAYSMSPKQAYRFLQQYIGTKIFRKRDKDFWVYRLREAIRQLYPKPELVVIDDGRFFNELKFVSNHGLSVGLKRAGIRSVLEHESELEAASIVDNGYCHLTINLPHSIEEKHAYNTIIDVILESVRGRKYA